MSTWYHYCKTCHSKGKVMTDKEADEFIPAIAKGQGKPSPVCCGKPMVLRSDDLLAGTFSINTR